MALKTRQNPETGALEVLVHESWVLFEEYRKRQIDDAYQSSIQILRDRLEDDDAARAEQMTEANSKTS